MRHIRSAVGWATRARAKGVCMPSKHRSDRGAALVEFALILPVFVMLLLGLITGGFALNEKQQLTHATREGARYAATVPTTQTWASGTWASNVRDLIIERSAGSLSAGDNVCVSLVVGNPGTVVGGHTTASGGAPCIANQPYPTNDPATSRRVQVTASKPATIETGLFGSYDVDLRAEATAKSESNT